MRRVKSFIKRNKSRYIKGALALWCINLLQIAIPKITGLLIDGISSSRIEKQGVMFYSFLVVIIAVLIFIMNYLTRLQIMGASILFQYETRNSIFKHLENLSIKFFNKTSVGDIMALVSNDVTAVRVAIGKGVTLIIDTLFLLALSLFFMGKTVSLKLTLAVFIPFPILIFAVVIFRKIINIKFKKVQKSFGDVTKKAQENVSGIRVIKAFSREKEEEEIFKKINEKNYEVNMELVKIWGMFYPLVEFVSSLSYLIVLFYGSILILKREITLGDFIAVNSYIGILTRPIKSIGIIINLIQKGKASMDRINQVFYTEKELKNKKTTNPCMITKLEGNVEFKNMTFSYSEESNPVLKDISFTLKKGKITAVVGTVGSGKSTLVNLILGFYESNKKGQLLIDGIDITDVPLKVLRSNIAYVPQENFLFSKSIKDNIGFYPESISEKNIKDAARISEIYDTIENMSKGFDTVLGERGVNISGGQKQRIAIARAIVKRPSIFIFDDCFSAIDVNTENSILKNIAQLTKYSSCLVIAHRLSTIKYADEIIVLEHGCIAEQGTHEELIKLKGIYCNMYEKQVLQQKT